MPEPIEVHASPLPDQLWAAVRQIAPAVMAFLIGRELIADDVVILLGVVGGIVWPIVAGQLKTRRRAQENAALAAELPDHIAKVK